MLGGMDGMQLVQTLRFKKIYTPILMLSALNSVQDKVTALDFGADDYITKPFHFDELLSRIKALTRRNHYQNQEAPSTVSVFGELKIDLSKHQVFLNDELIELSPREYKLLNYLIENIDKTVTRIQILNSVWGITFENHTNVVEMTLSEKIRLSRKFGKTTYVISAILTVAMAGFVVFDPMMIPTIIIIKILSVPVIYYLGTAMEKGLRMYFYINLGISRREFLVIPTVVEFLAFVVLMVITGIIGYAIG